MIRPGLIFRPWNRHPWQSLFHWLTLSTALGLAGLLAQILLHGHLDLPPGVKPQPGYYSLGGSDARGQFGPLSLLQAQKLLDHFSTELGVHSLYAELDLELSMDKNPARYYKVAVMQRDFLQRLGLQPVAGSGFSKEPRLAAQQALISHKLWNALGRPPPQTLSIQMNNRMEWTLAGVLPEGFSGFGAHAVDIWLPDTLLPDGLLRLNIDPATPPELKELTLRFSSRMPYFHILGIQPDSRLRARLEQGLENLDMRMPPLTMAGGPVITSGIAQARQALWSPGLNLVPELAEKTRRYTRLLQLIMVNLMILTLVSLVAFMLEQLPQRIQEFRLRHLYGASSAALAWQLFKENLGFSASTLPLAWLISWLLFQPLANTMPFAHFIPERLPPPGPELLLWGIMAAAAIAALLTLPPLWAIRRRLQPGTPAATADRGENHLLLALGTLQTLVATLALIIALLFATHLARDRQLDGHADAQVQLFTLGCAPEDRGCDLSALQTLDEKTLLARLKLPSGFLGLGQPLFGPRLGQKDLHLEPSMKTTGGAGRIDLAAGHFSRGWLQAMGVPLLAGRWPELPNEVLVNQAFLVNQGLSAEQAIGRQYQRDGAAELSYTVTGVIADLRLEDPRKPALPRMIFTLPGAIAAMPRHEIAWRQATAPGLLRQRLRAALNELGLGELRIQQQSLSQRIAERLQGERNFAALLAGSALFSMLLAVLGLYASTRHALSRQRQRLGIMLAYGALPRQAAGALYRERGLLLTIAVLLALFVLGLLQPQLNPWLLASRDHLPVVLLASLMLVLLAGLLATGLALRRLWRSQPMNLIREQP